MTDPAPAPAEQATTDRKQLIAAIILGLAAVLTALGSYSSSVSGSDAASLRTDAGRTLDDANFFYSQANQTQAGDQALFVAYATATQEGNGEMQEYLERAMRPVMQEAIRWWLDTEDALTPFEELEGNPYVLEDLAEANALEAEADAQVDQADTKDEKSSQFDLATVLLALTLFFAGVATLFKRSLVTWLLLSVSLVTLGIGSAILVQNLPA